jgi:chorismate synthase
MSHNSFGHLFRVTTWGESHGPALGCVVDGCPPGISFTVADIQAELDRRRPGQSRFVTQRREADEVKVLSGFITEEDGVTLVTTGTPISMLIENTDQRSKDYGEIARQYRPGHADYAYDVKYGLRDHRGGGRSSARETAARVAAGALARKVVPGLVVRGALVAIGEKEIDRAGWDWDFVDSAENRAGLFRLSGCRAQGRLFRRCAGRGRGRRRARRPRRAGLWQARSGHRLGADVDQRGQGRRDRRRLRHRAHARRGQCRRDAHGQ